MKKPCVKKTIINILMLILPLLVGYICLGIGRFSVGFGEIFDSLTGYFVGSTESSAKIIGSIRLPRVITALFIGAGLSASGVAFQSLFANPLATPDTLGVASGAGFGAALGLLLDFNLVGVQLLALVTGFVAVALSYFAGRNGKNGENGMVSIVLGGMVISSLFSALISLVKYVADADSQLPAITYWLMGSLTSSNYRTMAMGLPFIIIGCLMLFLVRWRMNVLPLSDDEAKATGTNVWLLRTIVIIASTMITASSVSMCGMVSWIGLLVPHICRMLFGSDTKKLVPASMSIGAVFTVIIDTVARSVTEAEIPISILTAIIGAPVFIALLRGKR